MQYYLRCLSISFLCLGFRAGPSLSAQNIISDMDHDARHVFDRMMIMDEGPIPVIHSSIFPYWRSDLVALADSFSNGVLSVVDLHRVQTIWDQNNEFLLRDSSISSTTIYYTDSTQTFHYLETDTSIPRYRKSKHPFWNTFYKSPAHFYEVDARDFYLRVNPILRFGIGRETEEGVFTFINQRGLSLRGVSGKMYSFIQACMTVRSGLPIISIASLMI